MDIHHIASMTMDVTRFGDSPQNCIIVREMLSIDNKRM